MDTDWMGNADTMKKCSQVSSSRVGPIAFSLPRSETLLPWAAAIIPVTEIEQKL